MHQRAKAVAWLLVFQLSVLSLVVGAGIAGVAAQFGGSGTWGVLLVACAAFGAVVLTLTREAVVDDGWPLEEPLDKLGVVASILSGAIALVATYLLIDLVLGLTRADGLFWPVLGALGVGGAWIALFGWVSDRRLIAASGHLLSLLAPWRYGYPFVLLAIVLALTAGATFRSRKLSSGAA